MGDYEAERRIAIMGYRSVGKSALTLHFVEGQFIENYEPTIEQVMEKKVKFFNRNFKLSLVDTAGQDEYTQVPRRYFADIHGYVIVYAINSLRSFQIVSIIYEKLQHISNTVPIILVGNKKDLNLEREVTVEQGKQLADQWKVPFIEVTAKDEALAKSVFQKAVFEVEKSLGNMKEEQKEGKCVLS